MWTHVVQITIPITFGIAIRNVFRNVILAHVNTAYDNLLFEHLQYSQKETPQLNLVATNLGWNSVQIYM